MDLTKLPTALSLKQEQELMINLSFVLISDFLEERAKKGSASTPVCLSLNNRKLTLPAYKLPSTPIYLKGPGTVHPGEKPFNVLIPEQYRKLAIRVLISRALRAFTLLPSEVATSTSWFLVPPSSEHDRAAAFLELEGLDD